MVLVFWMWLLGVVACALTGLGRVSTYEKEMVTQRRNGARMFYLSPIWPLVVLWHLPGAVKDFVGWLRGLWNLAWSK